MDRTTRIKRLMPQPLVIVIDLDGTVIGDILHAVAEREIVTSLCPDHAQARVQMKNEHTSRMRHGVVRPRFDAFVRKVEECNRGTGRHVELFVYTASEDNWALYVVSLLEAAVGFKVNRPIFSRKHCVPGPDGAFFKLLTPLCPSIVSSLRRKKYNISLLSLQENIILIDNNPSVIRTEQDKIRLVVCPTYNFLTAFDILSHVHVDIIHERYEAIARTLIPFGMYPASHEKDGGPPRSPRHFLRIYYSGLVERLKKTTRSGNGAELRDRFWVRMKNAIFNPSIVHTFDPSQVKTLNRRVHL